MTQDAATQRSFENLIGVEPVLGRVDRLAALLPEANGRTLFHAGPPFASFETVPPPVKNAAAAAAIHEGLAETREGALAAIAGGSIRLAPAQDIGLVTPLAFVVGPSLFCLEVVDANRPEHRRLAPLNDGPLPDALRFGTGRPEGLALLERLGASVGPDLARHMPAGTAMLPLLAKGLAGGDDLHGHVACAQSVLLDLFGDENSSDARSYMSEANQFVLNVIMATAAVMLGAGAGIADSNLVVAAGGNGVHFGYKVASAPDTWLTLPATRPQGPKFPGKEDAAALPAIGDSAVIDALGFGAACLRFCPTLAEALEGHIDPAFLTPTAHDAFVGPHPGLGEARVRVGLDLTRPRSVLGIMLGMVEASGTGGIIGRGVAPWPAG
jgi:hypothetical protein